MRIFYGFDYDRQLTHTKMDEGENQITATECTTTVVIIDHEPNRKTN